nr:DUF502 domain-containing protein [Telmatospirillum sp. J64-1]
MTFMGRLRAYFFAGVLITAPISITFYLAWLFIDFVDSQVTPLLPARYNLQELGGVPGIGLVIVAVGLTLIGFMTAGFVGRTLVKVSESILERMPVIRSIYSAIKQIFETVLAQQSTAFRNVVLIEYPRRGCWCLAFITGETVGEVQNVTEDTVLNVFLPTTPNPTSGYLLFLPKRDVHVLEMTVEEGIKMIMSGGIITPPDRRPAEEQEKPVFMTGPAGEEEEALARREAS